MSKPQKSTERLHGEKHINKKNQEKFVKKWNWDLAISFVRCFLPCIRLAQLKFELTNQDSAGSKTTLFLAGHCLKCIHSFWNVRLWPVFVISDVCYVSDVSYIYCCSLYTLLIVLITFLKVVINGQHDRIWRLDELHLMLRIIDRLEEGLILIWCAEMGWGKP